LLHKVSTFILLELFSVEQMPKLGVLSGFLPILAKESWPILNRFFDF
jgi:hypothetical protein